MHNHLFLKKITLSNLATFEREEVVFENSFNAIVGETGSGKSLLLDAIQLILGHRADKKLVRKGSSAATIEAIFECPEENIKNYFEEKGYPLEDDEIIIKRVLYSNGKSKAFVNYQACSLSILSDFSKRFIDLVGQFENQKLLNENYQLVLLDTYVKNDSLLNKYKNSYSLYAEKKRELEKLLTSEAEVAQKLDYINFQLTELSSLAPSEDTEAELIKSKEMILNKQERKSIASSIMNNLDGDDLNQGLISQVSSIAKLISNNSSLFNDADLEKTNTAQELLTELSFSISKFDETSDDEESISQIVNQLDSYQKLKRKFSTDTKGLEDMLQKFSIQKDELENYQSNKNLLEVDIEKYSKQSLKLANDLHDSRVTSSKELSKQLTKNIRALKMTGATIDFQVSKADSLNAYGNSSIKFMAETNPGEGYYPIKDIASGGELSRILLALRQVISSDDTISIFLFDEIDTGIGGETAIAIGKSLKAVSMSSQVIAITHLPQIALYTDNIVRVTKHITSKDQMDRTVSAIDSYKDEGIKEVIKLMNPME